MVPSPSQNTLGACYQITLFIPYYISSRLVTLPKVIDAPIQVPNIFYLTIIFKFLNLTFRYSFFLFLRCLLASRLTLLRLFTLLWFASYNHCILASFLCSKNPKPSSSNHGLCCFNSYSPRLPLAEILLFSLMFSQAQPISSLSLNFSKASNRSEILICFCFLTYSSFSYLRINLSPPNFCAACLLTANLSLTFANTT